ncbi:MAG: GspE/PulE family protein [Fimbriimonadaceae bacterium]
MAMKAYQTLAEGQLGVHIPANEESVRVVYGLVDSIIQDGISMQASDIHFEPAKDATLIRYRLDGRLKTVREIPRDLTHLVEYRLKNLAEINTNEYRVAQEGRYSASYGPNQVEVLVNTMPSTHGSRITLQILDRTIGLKKLHDLGMNTKSELFRDLINKPYGLFLIAGPSSSGKTTTAYAALTELQSEDRNIITCENPVEYDLRGITQTQVNQKVGGSYSDQVRSALKQDPDVIFIGEIADRQTADIALRAAMTGHFVIATVPGNDAASSIPNLLDLGVDSHLLSSVLVGTMSQRLLRKLDATQRESTQPTDEERFVLYRFFKEDEINEVYQPTSENSWKGRVAIHEVLPVTASIKKLIADKATSPEIREAAMEAGFVPMQKLAMDMVKAGDTTVSEAIHQLAFEITEPYGEDRATA